MFIAVLGKCNKTHLISVALFSTPPPSLPPPPPRPSLSLSLLLAVSKTQIDHYFYHTFFKNIQWDFCSDFLPDTNNSKNKLRLLQSLHQRSRQVALKKHKAWLLKLQSSKSIITDAIVGKCVYTIEIEVMLRWIVVVFFYRVNIKMNNRLEHTKIWRKCQGV